MHTFAVYALHLYVLPAVDMPLAALAQAEALILDALPSHNTDDRVTAVLGELHRLLLDL